MKRNLFHLWLALLLFSACSQEEAIIPDNGSVGEMTAAPISIRIQTPTSRTTVTEDDLYDKIDEVRILVYGRKKDESEFSLCSGDYIFKDAEGEIPCSEGKVGCDYDDTGDSSYRVAHAFFIPNENEKNNYEYRLYAFAYNKERWQSVKLNLDNKKLYYGEDLELDTDTGEPKVATVEESGYAYMELTDVGVSGKASRLDFFAGSVGYDFYNDDLTNEEIEMWEEDHIDGSTTRKLAGKLYRATGRLSFHLTGINGNNVEEQGGRYGSIRLLVDRYTTRSLIGLGEFWKGHKHDEVKKRNDPDYKPQTEGPWLYNVFGYGWDNQRSGENGSEQWTIVSEVKLDESAEEVDLYMDCLPAHQFVVYVQPVYEDGTVVGTYRIHCAAKEYYPGYEMIKDMVVDGEGRFTVVTNGWGLLDGEFNNLNNLKIDLGWGDDYQGPVLGEE